MSFNEVGHAGDSHCLRSVLDVPYVCVGKHMKTEDIGSPVAVAFHFLLYLARITTTTLRRLVLFAFSLLSFVGVNEA